MSVEIRFAEPDDADAVATLLIELGYDVTSPRIRQSLSAMKPNLDPVFVASNKGEIVGMVSLIVCRWIQWEKPIARVPAMIVHDAHQRRGVGRALVEHAVTHARQLGCGAIELTSANDRAYAHAFYRDIGFAQTSLRFKKLI
ncbi:MAG: GNAT family N-acetyltransferase [Alphaproteobacteria bacterium]|nr:GNAT family N-acetyltransferase [Alphaproteobacteria bacterium]